jgi:hypothetical protein
MTNASLIQIRRAGFRVTGKARGLGLVLLYQDKLARVSQRAEVLGCFLGPFIVLGIIYPSADGFGAAAGVLVGRWLGEQVDRRTAARRVAHGGRGVTVIPLDSIASVSTGSKDFLGTPILVVTTQDGTEYRFYGQLGTWQADLAAALTVRGRSVQVTPGSITVIPPTVED